MAAYKRTTIIISLLLLIIQAAAGADPHIIRFRSPDLYPEGMVWDPTAQHFIVGSLFHRTIAAVTDAGVVSVLLADPSLPANATILGLAVDNPRRRLLAAVHSLPPLPPFNALAAYDLTTHKPIFITPLRDTDTDTDDDDDREEKGSDRRDIANGVAVDFDGNAYVTNAGKDFIWKVKVDGSAEVFSRSEVFRKFSIVVDEDNKFRDCGLNGIAYVSKGYLIVAQSNTGKLFKVDAEDGTARVVIVNEVLTMADDVAERGDGVLVVVSPVKGVAWLVKSRDSWGEAVVVDRIGLDKEGFPTSVAVGGGGRVYVLYGYVEEGVTGKNVGREWFRIEEIWRQGGEDEMVWVFVLVGLGLAYFLFWRFQMRQLVKNLDKKRS